METNEITNNDKSMEQELFGYSGDDHIYEGTDIKKLLTKESPKQILTEDYPKKTWPISGGWGYTKEDAVVIEINNHIVGVMLEYEYLKYRSFEEAIVFREKGQRLAGFKFERGIQALMKGEDGKHYDRIFMTVTAFKEEDFEFLRDDWEKHNAYADDEEGKNRHLQLAETKKIKYQAVGWFDISSFYGK